MAVTAIHRWRDVKNFSRKFLVGAIRRRQKQGMSDIEQLAASALADIAAATTTAALEDLRVAVLGKSGTLTALLKQLGALAPDERKQRGAEVNLAKERVADALSARKDELDRAETAARLVAERVDITLPGRNGDRGGLHPITRTLDRISAICAARL
jgi:phenylalanyl-tRNA synthetase alpha chain